MDLSKELKQFKAFLLRGNILELAIAVVIGAAFSGLVNSFVTDIITPFLGIFGGTPSFSSLYFTINDSRFMYGSFLTALISFIIMAAVIYFFVVKPINMVMEKMKKGETTDSPTKQCPFCISDIPTLATKCKYCASEVK
jgi:large conductance mechanosensitive channel